MSSNAEASAEPPGQTFGGLPLSFEENLGQADEQVRFVARTGGSTVFFTKSEAVFVYRAIKSESGKQDKGIHESPETQTQVIRMAFEGANPGVEVTGEGRQEGRSNYFIGNDPAKWQTDVPNYSKALYRNIYSGIDLVFYEGPNHQLEYDFVVAPGADPKDIALRFEGADRLATDEAGNLVLATPLGPAVHQSPVAYQSKGNAQMPVESRWEHDSGRVATITTGEYDTTLPLVIDPVALGYSSYLGGSSGDYGLGIAIDSTGAAFVTGKTASTNFPTTSPLQGTRDGTRDAFVTKINPAGSAKVYSSYLGGSGLEDGSGIAIDSTGAAYVTGETDSTNFPTASAFQASNAGITDAFVVKINPAGSALAYSSYLGGSSEERAPEIAVDITGTAYVTGQTYSTDFPTASAFQGSMGGDSDAFVTKINQTGSGKVYSSYLGGSTTDFSEFEFPCVEGGRGIAVDSAGAAYVAGFSQCTDFPTTSPFQGTKGGATDPFVTKFNPEGSALVYSTYLGGDGTDYGRDVAVDSAGAAYVTGETWSTNFPTASAFQASNAGITDAFVTKFNPAGSALVYSTYLGGGVDDDGQEIAVDSAGAAYVTGVVNSTDFPTTFPIQGSKSGPLDAFVTKFNPAGSALVYSTYLGGSSDDGGFGIAVDSASAAYVAGQTSYGVISGFPVTTPFQGSSGGGSDAFVARLDIYPKRANVNSDGTQSAGPASKPDVANSGSRVAFHSPVGDLVAGDSNGFGDVFVKSPPTGAIERVSVDNDGTQANGGSIAASMSPDSRYVAFFSQASNLTALDTNGVGDVFLRDRTLGITERVSIADDGSESNGASRYPQVTPDGRYVVFQSEASNLVAGDTNGKWDIFLRDRDLGTTERISVADDESQSDKASARPSVSDDGNLITFHSWATNLVASDTNGLSDVFVRNRSGSTTTRASVATDGTQGNGESQFPKISGDGSVVVFHSAAAALVAADSNGARDVFGRVLGASATERISLTDGDTEANNSSGYADISTNGRYVSFHSTATDLAAGDTNLTQDIFVRDRTSATTVRASIAQDLSQTNDVSGMSAISPDGLFVAFQSQASNLVPGDTNAAQDIFDTPRPRP